MKKSTVNNKSKLSATFLLLIFCFNLIAPTPVYARISFRKFFRSLKRATRFVIQLPEKSTRWMGPVLGPIAADLISYNLGSHHKLGKFFKKARRLDKTFKNIEEQKKLMNELKGLYTSQSQDLSKKAQEIRDYRKSLAELVTKGELSFDDFKEKVVDLEQLAGVYDEAANKFKNSADKLKPTSIVKLLGRDFFKNTLSKLKNLVAFETSKELSKYINPNVLKTLLSQDNLSLDGFIDLLVSGDLKKLLGNNNESFDLDSFKDELKQKIKQDFKNNKEDFKNNWQKRIDEIIKKMIEDRKGSLPNLPDMSTPTPQPKTDEETKKEQDDLFDELLDFEEDAKECPNGYVYKPHYGVDCVQIDCEKGSIANAHLGSTGHCVCGSSGSMFENPEDPNKECAYDSSYKTCPSCVYSCVHFEEDCPAKPK
jgi:hypothetical protein